MLVDKLWLIVRAKPLQINFIPDLKKHYFHFDMNNCEIGQWLGFLLCVIASSILCITICRGYFKEFSLGDIIIYMLKKLHLQFYGHKYLVLLWYIALFCNLSKHFTYLSTILTNRNNIFIKDYQFSSRKKTIQNLPAIPNLISYYFFLHFK